MTYLQTSIVIVLVVLVMVVGALALGAGAIAMQECKALGYEWGVQVWWPEPHVECEYRLRVPLREANPPIQGGMDNGTHLPSSMVV